MKLNQSQDDGIAEDMTKSSTSTSSTSSSSYQEDPPLRKNSLVRTRAQHDTETTGTENIEKTNHTNDLPTVLPTAFCSTTRLIATCFLLMSISYCLTAQLLSWNRPRNSEDDEPEQSILPATETICAIFVLAATSFLHLIIRFYLSYCGEGVSKTLCQRNFLLFIYYLDGVVIYSLMAVAFFFGVSIYEKIWAFLFLWKYSFDVILLVSCWSKLPAKWSIFFSIHHTLALLSVGSWYMLQGPWEKGIIIGSFVWLTSDYWGNCVALYRIVRRNHLGKRDIVKIQKIIFVVERAHRIVAYITGLVFTYLTGNFPLSKLAVTVLVSAFALDLLDTSVQIRGLMSRSRAVNQMQTEEGTVDTDTTNSDNLSVLSDRDEEVLPTLEEVEEIDTDDEDEGGAYFDVEDYLIDDIETGRRDEEENQEDDEQNHGNISASLHSAATAISQFLDASETDLHLNFTDSQEDMMIVELP